MDWLVSLDNALFRSINQGWANPYLDWLMPFVSGNPFFFPVLTVVGIYLLTMKGARGRVFVVLLLLILLIGDAGVSASLKKWFGRPRPFRVLEDARLIVGMGDSGSMPSGHTNMWFIATTVCFWYYRRLVYFMLPMACLVALSRIYNGVHYPSDILAGAVLGITQGAVGIWLADELWRRGTAKWFPLWYAQLPSLKDPVFHPAPPGEKPDPVLLEQQWLRLGYFAIGLMLVGRLVYLGIGRIELSEDEAYQWVWSKHLALSYYSKPPMIAYTQFLGTTLFGDTMFGVRFFSPVITAVISFLMLRFLAREVSVRAGMFFVFVCAAAPMPAVGAVLMTIDPLSVLFWSLALLSGWTAVQQDSQRAWLWTGFWMGLGFLSKYTALFQLACWLVFFALWQPARAQLKKPGPYLALAVMALCTIPVLIWNAQNGWPTVTHLAERAGLDTAWKFTPNFLIDFTLAEIGLLNPVLFVGMLWACVGMWRHSERRPLCVYLFCMGAPLFIGYWLYTIRARVQPNWIAPAILPLFALMVVYWHERWKAGATKVKWLGIGAIGFGIVVVTLLHETRLIGKLTGKHLPAHLDPLTRVRGWESAARVVEGELKKLGREGKPVFVIGYHYGITGLLSFYMPAGRAGVKTDPVVFYRTAQRPSNQFYFWPGYRGHRQGQNALYVEVVKSPLNGVPPEPPPELLREEFASITDLGTFPVEYRGNIVRSLRLVACRGLK